MQGLREVWVSRWRGNGWAGEEGLEGPSGYLQGGLGPLRVGSKLGVELQVGAEALQSLSPVPSFQVGKQLSAWVRTTKELPQNCSSAAFHPSNPDPWVVLLPLLQMENAGTGPRPQVRSLADSEYEPGSLRAVPEAKAPAPSLSPRPFHSLAGAANELPGPKQGLALRWSQGALGSQNPHEVLRRENAGVWSAGRGNAKARLQPAEVCPAPSAGGQSRTPGPGITALAETLPHPGLPPHSRGHAGPPPWPPAPAAPGSAAPSPAAPGRCRRASAPNGHAAPAPGTGPWAPGSPCLADQGTLPATARRRFKCQPLRGRTAWRRAPPGAGRLRAGRSLRGGLPSSVSAPLGPRPTARAAL